MSHVRKRARRLELVALDRRGERCEIPGTQVKHAICDGADSRRDQARAEQRLDGAADDRHVSYQQQEEQRGLPGHVYDGRPGLLDLDVALHAVHVFLRGVSHVRLRAAGGHALREVLQHVRFDLVDGLLRRLHRGRRRWCFLQISPEGEHRLHPGYWRKPCCASDDQNAA